MWNSRFALVAVALVGVAFGAVGVGPARAEIDAVMSCAKSGPCLQWSNSLTGDAIKGVSSKGNAVHGQTKFNSTGKTAGKAGVLGEDISSSGVLDAGVSGISTNGAGVVPADSARAGARSAVATAPPARRPDMVAFSAQPRSSGDRVQSPARYRFSKPDWSWESLYFVLVATERV